MSEPKKGKELECVFVVCGVQLAVQLELRSAAIDFTSSELFQSAFKFARLKCILMNQKLMLRVTCR